MLLRRTLTIALALLMLGVTTLPNAVAVPSECQAVPNPDAGNGRLGRPCLTITTPHPAACVPWGTLGFSFDSDSICTYYLVLVPLTDDGNVLDPELDTWVLYGETNGLDGLQTLPMLGRSADNWMLLI